MTVTYLWVKTDVLLKADKIYNSEEEYVRTEYDINISVHIAPTELNIHLPETYFEDTARGKPEWWIARYLNGSFQNKEGLVYPRYEEHIVDDFDIPEHWQRRVGGDFGLNNPTAFGVLATNPEDGTTYLYWEHEEAQKPVSHHAEILKKHINVLSYNVIRTMVGDAAGQQKTAGDLNSVFDHYAEYGIYWSPSTKKLEDSIMKMYTYFDLGKFKIFRSCVSFISEISQYRYPERSLDKALKNEDMMEKPIAVNDHLLDAVRYVVAELPDDPDKLINKSYNARFTMRVNSKLSSIPPELQTNTNKNSYSRKDAWLSY